MKEKSISGKRSKDFDLKLLESIPHIRAWCVSCGASYSDLDDIIQNTLLAALEQHEELRPDIKITTWLFAIARNKILQVHSNKKKREFISLDQSEAFTALVSKPENSYDFNLLSRTIENKIDDLHGTKKDIIELFLRGFSVKQIAEELKLSSNYAKTRLYHVRVDLAKAIGTIFDKTEILSRMGIPIGIPISERREIIKIENPKIEEIIVSEPQLIPPGLLSPMRGSKNMIESTYNYLIEIWKRFAYTKNIYFLELQLAKIRQRNKIKGPYSCFINKYFLVVKRRVYSLRFPDIEPTYEDATFLYEEFKEYERNKIKNKILSLTEEERLIKIKNKRDKRNENKEHVNKRKRELHVFNKEIDNERGRKNWAKNKEKYKHQAKEYRKEYYSTNKEELNRKSREYFKLNKDAIVARRKELRHLKKQEKLSNST